MSRRRENNTTHSHLLNAGIRGFLTALATIYTSSAFVATVGAAHYAQLAFFSFMASAALYALFLFISTLQMARAYIAFLLIMALATAWLFSSPTSVYAIYVLSITALIIDIIGINVVTAVAQQEFNPVVFRELYQRMLSYDLGGRIVASAFLYFASKTGWITSFYLVLGASLILHTCINAWDIRRVKKVDPESDVKRTAREVVKIGKQSVKFIFSNSLVRIAVIALIWARVARYGTDSVFYYAVQSRLNSVSEVTSFISLSNSASIMFTLLFQFTLARSMRQRLSLSSLLGILPLTIAAIGLIILSVSPFYPALILMVAYQCVFRVIYYPVIRQCLLPVPRNLSHGITSTVMLASLLSSMLVSGGMSSLRGFWSINEFTFFLILISLGILYFITQLDTFYMKNLWSHYSEAKNEITTYTHWGEQLDTDLLGDRKHAGADREQKDLRSLRAPESAMTGIRQQVVQIFETYKRSYRQQALSQAVKDHKSLLESKIPEKVLYGITLMEEVALPEFQKEYARLCKHSDADVRDRAQRSLEVHQVMARLPLERCPVSARHKLQEILQDYQFMDQLEYVHKKLEGLMISQSSQSLIRWISALHWSGRTELRDSLLKCCGDRVDLMPLIDDMFAGTFNEAREHRQLLIYLGEGWNRKKAFQRINKRIAELGKSGITLGSRSQSSQHRVMRQQLMHLLFLDEWALAGTQGGASAGFLDSISEWDMLRDDEKQVLRDIHLEYLKKSRHYRTWERVLSD